LPILNLAVQLTPHGIPLVAYPVSILLLAVVTWEALRYREEPWFKYLQPLGILMMVGGVFLLFLPVSFAGALVLSVSIGLSKYWRSVKLTRDRDRLI
jgi:hypothetical protein